MTDSPKVPHSAGMKPDVLEVGSAGRRRLLQAGISTAPVIMTVLSRPVLAQAGNCQSPSGFVSGNASNPGMNMCSGFTPAYWVTQGQTPNGWPAGTPSLTHPDHVKVKKVFGGTDQTTKLLDVLNGTNAPAQIAAAYLNIRAGGLIPPTVLALAQVQHMWTEFAATGGYTPSAGAHWDAAELVDYLQRLNNRGIN